MDSVNKALQKKDPNGNDTAIRISQVIAVSSWSSVLIGFLAWCPNQKFLGSHDRVQEITGNISI